MDSTAASELCLRCGLCCDGTLFATVPVGSDAPVVVRLRDAGAAFSTDADDANAMELPCVAHREGVCTVYDDRPEICRKYECRVLRSTRQGTLTTADALELIEKTRRVAATLWAALWASSPGSGGLLSLVREFNAEHRDELADPDFRREHAEVLMNIAALLDVLRPRFVDPRRSAAARAAARAADDAPTMGD